MTDDEKDEIDLLTEAVEDWQHLSSAAGTFQDLPRGKGAVHRLLQKNLITLWWHQHWTTPAGVDNIPPEELAVSRLEEALKHIEAEEWWIPHDDPESGFYSFTASKDGKVYYFADPEVANYMRNEWEIRAQERGHLRRMTEEEKQQLSIEASRKWILEQSKRLNE